MGGAVASIASSLSSFAVLSLEHCWIPTPGPRRARYRGRRIAEFASKLNVLNDMTRGRGTQVRKEFTNCSSVTSFWLAQECHPRLRGTVRTQQVWVNPGWRMRCRKPQGSDLAHFPRRIVPSTSEQTFRDFREAQSDGGRFPSSQA